jgi:uncharacterized membrane protein YfhO
MELDVTTAVPGVVVFRDAYFPGWRVFVDGRQGTVCRVDGMFLGAIVDAGRHRVEFRYVPPGWPAVLAAEGIGLVVVVGLLACPRRRTPRRRIRA